jgi:putative transposase
LTFSCYRRLPLLTNDDWRGRLCRSIDAAGKKPDVELVGFVLMPEHVHLLVYPLTDSQDGNIPDYLQQLKQPFSKEIKKAAEGCQEPVIEAADRSRATWQDVLSLLAGGNWL